MDINPEIMKKAMISMVTFLISPCLTAQDKFIDSHVYNWNDLEPIKEETRVRRQILEGNTTALAYFEIHASTLEPGKAPHPSHTHDDMEELIIIREGKLKVTIMDKSKVLGPGSVALAIPGEEHGFENGGDTTATYYVLKFKARSPLNEKRGIGAGGSFMIDWNEVPVVTHERGARRNFFDRPTSVFARFEMHVTTLNKGLDSHSPHTHLAEEIILLLRGDAEMTIGESKQKTASGGLVFLASEVPHALTNKTDGQCEYFAFQWNN